MTARFAGSKSLDERRRRRLAGEWEDENSTERAASVGGSAEVEPVAPPTRRGRKRKPARRLPLRRVISPRLWKHAALAIVLFAIGAGMLWAGLESRAIGRALGPEVEQLVSLDSARLIRGYGGVLLLVAAELSLLIWYVRSRSRRDFSGRYRSWAWAASAGFVFSASVSLELHRIWSAALAYALHLDTPSFSTLCWLAPAMGCATVLIRDLYSDMRDCKSSVAFLRGAFLFWTVSAVTLLGYGVAVPSPFAPLLVPATALCGHFCLFLAMLLHTRFVIYVSAEPPDLRTPLWKTVVRVGTRPLRAAFRAIRSRRPTSDDSPTTSNAGKPDSKSAATSDGDRETAKSDRRRKLKTRKKRQPAASDESDTPKPAEAKSPVSNTESAESKPNRRVDAPHATMAMPSGLSKRERRKLRKQQAAERNRG